MNTPTLDLEKITKIYSGPSEGCRCGCKGSYAEKGTRAFALRLKKFAARLAETDGVTRDYGGNYLDLSKDGRSLCAYND